MIDSKMKLPLDKGLVSPRLTILRTIQLALGDAAGSFLMIEPLMPGLLTNQWAVPI